jgi:guanine nucleotide-exchange factor
MGNMMDNLLVRSFTSKSKGRTDDVAPESPVKVYACSFFSLHMI